MPDYKIKNLSIFDIVSFFGISPNSIYDGVGTNITFNDDELSLVLNCGFVCNVVELMLDKNNFLSRLTFLLSGEGSSLL